MVNQEQFCLKSAFMLFTVFFFFHKITFGGYPIITTLLKLCKKKYIDSVYISFLGEQVKLLLPNHWMMAALGREHDLG